MVKTSVKFQKNRIKTGGGDRRMEGQTEGWMDGWKAKNYVPQESQKLCPSAFSKCPKK